MNFEKLIPVFEPVFKKYWDNKWTQRTIRYTMITGENPRDIRDILEPTCMEVEVLGNTIDGEEPNSDKKALACLRYVMRNIRYVRDINNKNKPEFWQEAPETFATKKGDCEDGAILLMKILEAANIPEWRRKLCAGDVLGGGHAYVIYLNNHFEWMILDWCYWPVECIENYLKRIPHSRQSHKYQNIWFTWNEEKSWNQNSTIIDEL